jgi:hypothetical protein
MGGKRNIWNEEKNLTLKMSSINFKLLSEITGNSSTRRWWQLLNYSITQRSKAWVCGRSLTRIVGSNPAGGMDVVSVVCCQVEVSATGWFLVRSPTECGVSECDREASIMRSWPARGCCAIEKKKQHNGMSKIKDVNSINDCDFVSY